MLAEPMRHRFDTTFVFVVAAVLAVAGLGAAPSCARAADSEFFFYSPQVGTGNLSQLKQVADRFLRSSQTSLSFQPFARFEDLEREFDRHQPAFLIAPEWVAIDHCLGKALRPLARPVRNGKLYDRRALVASRAATGPADIEGGAIAATVPATGLGSSSASLAHFRRQHPDVRVIPVPKDIDALLAVGFGQVDAAFVSMTQLEMLARVNPALTGKLHELGYSTASPFPALYATEFADDKAVAGMRTALRSIGENEAGARLVRLLGYDGWRDVAEAEQAIEARSCGQDTEVGR